MAKKNKRHSSGRGVKKHVRTSAADGGACLTGHQSAYKTSSCSYRWQAHEESKASRTGVYNKTPRTSTPVDTSAYVASSRRLFPRRYGRRLPAPQSGDWYLTGPTRADMKDAVGRRVPPGANFQKNWLWPYWHNSHHLIPKGTFNQTVDEVDPAKCRNLIRIGLISAEYNINHHINVFILPQDKEVARLLKLPRHLILEDGATSGGAEYFDHAAYNANVRSKLKDIIRAYKKICDDELRKKCVEPDFKLSKKRLENLSRSCMDKIKGFGRTDPGEPISDMPPL